MSFEIWMLLASVVLLFAQISIQSVLLTQQLGPEYNASPRDEDKPLHGRAARAKRMVANFLETYPAFIALALAVHVTGATDRLTQWGAAIYLVGRIVYIPLYISGVSYVRSIAFVLASLGLLGMAIGLAV